jgi:hypothetical protein
MEKIVNTNITLINEYKEMREDPKNKTNLYTFLTKPIEEEIEETYLDYLRDINSCYGYLAPGSAPVPRKF